MIVGLPDDSPPVKRAHWLRFGEGDKRCVDCAKPKAPSENWPGDWCKCKAADELKALDIGAGGQRRKWDGYRTFTTDIRRDTKPDYVMDSRLLNLPDESFDLTASSHHLEHIGRLDQERVWAEIFRITKPGGKCEHIVPNWVWAANKLIEAEKGYDDSAYEHVGNVCYGAQEAHGYERIYNTHFMLYTPRIAKELAEGAGFVDVTTESYRENEGLGYNLVIRGRKLKAGEEKPLPELVPAIVESNGHTNGKPKRNKLKTSVSIIQGTGSDGVGTYRVVHNRNAKAK
jgi:predicted SAM-dependent methyltransferase